MTTNGRTVRGQPSSETETGERPSSRQPRDPSPRPQPRFPRPCASPVLGGSAYPSAAGASRDGIRLLTPALLLRQEHGHQAHPNLAPAVDVDGASGPEVGSVLLRRGSASTDVRVALPKRVRAALLGPVSQIANLAHRPVVNPSVDRTVGPEDLVSVDCVYAWRREVRRIAGPCYRAARGLLAEIGGDLSFATSAADGLERRELRASAPLAARSSCATVNRMMSVRNRKQVSRLRILGTGRADWGWPVRASVGGSGGERPRFRIGADR